jgi:hypothetical protein
MHSSTSDDKLRFRKIAGRANVIPMHMTQHHGVHFSWVYTTSSQTFGHIWANTSWLTLSDMMLLRFSIAGKIAFETEIKDEIG